MDWSGSIVEKILENREVGTALRVSFGVSRPDGIFGKDRHPDAVEQTQLIARGRQLAEELGTLAPDQVRAMLMRVLSRIDIRADRIEINVRRCRLVELLSDQSIDVTAQAGTGFAEYQDYDPAQAAP